MSNFLKLNKDGSIVVDDFVFKPLQGAKVEDCFHMPGTVSHNDQVIGSFLAVFKIANTELINFRMCNNSVWTDSTNDMEKAVEQFKSIAIF